MSKLDNFSHPSSGKAGYFMMNAFTRFQLILVYVRGGTELG